MAIKIGINGFGRIGKLVARAAIADGGFEIVGINDLMTTSQIAHAMKYDSTQGKFDGTVEARDNSVVFNNKEIKVTAIKDPSEIPWKSYDIDIVLESTGIFATAELLQKHIDAGAKKVLLSVPPKDKSGKIKVIVYGVNQNTLNSEDTMVSNASCTTNCLAPMAKVLNDTFGIEKGLMTTIHAYTNDQNILDQVHKDPRRARAGALSMIPTTTGAARAVGVVIPELNGKLNGMSIRVPTPTGSVTDLVAILKKNVTKEEVNSALKSAAEGELKGILEYTEEPIVSADIIHNPASSIVDGLSTMIIEDNMVKVLSWYDNEWGYSTRCIDLFKLMAE
ncbi:MAG: type I glyceraldehyde-3-phosphate dehydrogenase [Chitinispirillia bacterium]|jgi:glyceraldehyde 3-phosphate dehydrogenase